MKSKKLTNILLAIILTGMAGCSTSSSIMEGKGKTLSLTETQFELIDTTFFHSTTVIALETNDKSLFRKADRICMEHDTLFVLDATLGKVIIFDKNGRYINDIHAIGNGPKEYVQISDISICPAKKCIAVLCNQPYKTLYYTYSGDFIKEAAFSDCYSEFVIQNDNLYCYSAQAMGKRKFDTYRYPMKEKNEMVIPDGLFFDSESPGNIFSFTNGKRITMSGEILFTWPFDYSIYSIEDGQVYEKYKIEFGDRQLPKELLKEKLSPFDFLDLCDKKKYIHSIHNIVVNSDYMLFCTNKPLFVYNKTADKLTGYSFIRNTALNGGPKGRGSYISLNNSDYIAQIWQPDDFKQRLDDRKERNGNLNGVDPQYLDLYNVINDDDNPILVLYELPHKKQK